ncbi:MAG: DUF1553 domain-containing protein [Bryobacteraceae bacterium]
MMKFLWLAFPVACALAASVDFNREIRPILSDRCFTCHGPDTNNRMAGLRLDTEEGAKRDLGKGRFAIVPGDLAKSLAYQRVITTEKAKRMPPAHLGAALSEREAGLLRRWIEEGAQWQKHWSLLPPQRLAVPKVSNPAWVRNPIDAFILARLDREGLKPSPEADKATLLRRVSIDLTGIPPTPAEVAAFVNDSTPDAYEHVVDRLLRSPRYGERMAARWLDAARYADTNGYQTDAERFMWRWRDWVIEAFNKNMPFDQFTIEQLAGDLLPNPTLDQLIATGFNRNHRGNGEGGSIPAEFLVEYHVDRVDTTSTVWMGLTLGCSRCHDHKYDPFTQKEFYSLIAFFNNLNEKGKVFKYGNSPPMIPAPTRDQQTDLAAIEQQLRDATAAFDQTAAERKKLQSKWEKELASSKSAQDWYPRRELMLHFPLAGAPAGRDRSGKEMAASAKDGDIAFAPGARGATFDGKGYVDAGNHAPFGFYSKFSLTAWIKPESPDGAIVTRAIDQEEQGGWGLYLKGGKVQLNLVQRWLDDCLRVESVDTLEMNRGYHVAVSYDATRIADGIKLYIDGKPAKLKYIVDDLNQSFQVKEPVRIGAGNGFRFRGLIGDVRIYNDVISPTEASMLATTDSLNAIAKIPAARRSAGQAAKLEGAFLESGAPAGVREAWQKQAELQKKRQNFLDNLPTVMVMKDEPQIRDTFLLQRGVYDRPGARVTRGVPAALPQIPADLPMNRLGLAKWLVSAEHPLTARVTVNRYWQMMFGAGIVKTVEDFGSQGEWPVHPELLDWLAVEFREKGWDVKGIVKTIVMSNTYRQRSSTTPELVQKDPDNRLLAHGPRYRLPAEVVRDQALAVSGLLVEHLGGPSVKPYQPAGLWKELAGGNDYQRDHGDKLYRRSLYTFWKRASPPPGMMTFDSAGREACTVRENRTNTPLQALTLMNDETYLEAARKLAERMIHDGGAAPESRLAYGFQLATSRKPKEREQAVLLTSFHNYRDRYKTDPAKAAKFLAQGESPMDKSIDTADLAAYSTVASLILNLDEVVTKE